MTEEWQLRTHMTFVVDNLQVGYQAHNFGTEKSAAPQYLLTGVNVMIGLGQSQNIFVKKSKKIITILSKNTAKNRRKCRFCLKIQHYTLKK
jgi:hypothetical protein